jgi:hypothetical protein
MNGNAVKSNRRVRRPCGSFEKSGAVDNITGDKRTKNRLSFTSQDSFIKDQN